VSQIDPAWEISVQEVKRMMDEKKPILLIDVREKDEHAQCRIDGATLVPLSELGGRLSDIQKLADGRPVVTHCHHGGRSLRAADALRQAGVEGVRSMAGGIDEWSVAIDPKVARY